MSPFEATPWMAAFTAAVVDADTDPDPHTAALRAVVAALPAADGAALTTTRGGKPTPVAFCGNVAERFFTAQRHCGQGPTLQSLKDRALLSSTDLTTDLRWPKLGMAAALLPNRSVLASPLLHAHPRAVTLTLYAAEPAALNSLDVELLDLVLTHTNLTLAGLAQHRRVQHLERAMRSNEKISIAVGILMTLNDYGEDDAMTAMALASQAENRKLNDIATDVVLTGAIPLTPPDGPSAPLPAHRGKHETRRPPGNAVRPRPADVPHPPTPSLTAPARTAPPPVLLPL